MKKTLLAASLALASLAASAADYYVVVPVAGKAAATAAKISVTLGSQALPAGQVGVPYAGYDLKNLLQVSGDALYTGAGVTWSIASGALPAGLSLSSNGVISGTPTAGGTSDFQVKATYKLKSGQQAYQIVIANIVVALSDATLPVGKVNAAYAGFDLNTLLNVTGDNAFNSANVAWSVASGALPSGLSLSSSGHISGTPTSAVTNLAFEAQASYKGVSAKRGYQLTVDPRYACTTPWGETMASDTTYPTQVYTAGVVNYPGTCTDKLTSLSCADGTLSVASTSKTCYVHDPDWASVVSLLKFDGTWSDAKGTATTPSGTATLVSSDSKFGGGSASFGPAAGMVTMSRGPFQFGYADFTIEMFIKPNNTTTNGQLAGLHKNAISNDWLFYYNMGKLVFMWGPPSVTSTNAAMTAGVWHHVAVTRSGSTLNLWLDGSKVGTTTITGAMPNATSWPMTIGSDVSSSLNFQGGIDSFRVTAGKARYTANFTVPATDFPSQ